MTVMAMRIAVDNRPGALAGVAAALAGLDANIVDVDVHEMDAAMVVDEIVLDVPDGVSPERVREALIGGGAASVTSLPLFHRTTDAQTRCLTAVATLLETGVDGDAEDAVHERALIDAIRALVPVEDVAVGRGSPHPAAREALAQGVPVAMQHPSGDRWTVALEVPDRDRPPTTVTLQRARLRFSATDIARVRALLRVYAQAARLRGRSGGDARAA